MDSTSVERIIATDTLNLEDALLRSAIDTNESYAQEFICDRLRFQWGIRGGISQSQMSISNILPNRVNAGGSPILVNGAEVRDGLLRLS